MRKIVTGMLVLALVGAALPALAQSGEKPREGEIVAGIDQAATTTFALSSAGAPVKKGNYKAAAELPTAKQLMVSGQPGGK